MFIFECQCQHFQMAFCLGEYNKGIRVPKVPFRVFDKLKNEIQNFIVRFCFYLNMKNEIKIFDCHFHV